MRLSLNALAIALLLAAAPASAAGLEGVWLTATHDGVIAIAPCAADLCGRIVGMGQTRRPDGSLPADPQGHPMCGLTILRAAADGPDRWAGDIIDPQTGTSWQCTLHLDEAGHLLLRGYVLLPLLGQTQTWTRYTGKLAADCAMP